MTDSLTDVRLLLPEIIWLESEHFDRASAISDRLTDEAKQWQTYLNVLAQLSFAQWLRERIPKKSIDCQPAAIEEGSYLEVGEFKIYLIALESLLDETVPIAPANIFNPTLAAHFYTVLEVSEEEEQVTIRGCLRYDELDNYLRRQEISASEDGMYYLPLSLFDAEPNHLLFYCQHLQPNAIPLPVAETGASSVSPVKILETTRNKLSQWLTGVLDEGWQAIDFLISPETSLAFSTRNATEGLKVGKLVRLNGQLGDRTLALLITVTPSTAEKLQVSVGVHPIGTDNYLPPDLQLTLLSKAGKMLQEVRSHSQDDYIQLKSFKGQIGKQFALAIVWGEVNVTEVFEL